MPQTVILIECANCGRPVREADAEALGRRFYSDGVGELPTLLRTLFAPRVPA